MSKDKKHILVVEDNITAFKVAKHLLEMLGCQIDYAGDGDKAIDLAMAKQ